MKLKISLLVLTLFCASLLLAHPASEMKATFDKAKGILTLTYDHKVKDVNDHFIDDVKVLLNKRQVINQLISRQDTQEGGMVIYHMPDVKAGDKLTVITECNKGGKKSVVIEAK